MTEPNPLLSIQFNVPFDRITPEHVEPAIGVLLKQAELALEEIENCPDPRDYGNTLGALDVATESLDTAMGVIGHLESVASTTDLRQAYNKIQPEVSAFYAGIVLRPKLWTAIKQFAKSDEARALTGARKRYLKKTVDDFRRNGADLGEAGKERLRQISRELAELTSKFSQNVVDETAAFELLVATEEELRGLPEPAIAQAKADADAKGKSGYRLTLQAPSLIPVLNYLEDRSIREKIWRAYNTRASSGDLSNVDLTVQILALRKEQAQVLGYNNFAELVLEDRMAKSAQTALAFITDLHQRSAKFFERETAALDAFRNSTSHDTTAMCPWDVGYYSEKQRKALFDFDQEALRPYLPIDQVMAGLFETALRLYGLRITPNTTLSVWHESVKTYDILSETGEHLASFYADLFPREEKRGGAWMNSFISGTQKAGKQSPHLGLICANVTPPLGDRPALLTHDELTTMFHEFGHLLHHCLSRVEVRSLAGTNVAWDFVELPSQIMENWCWEKDALDTFAKHYESGETIPQDLFDKLKRARTYRAASATMRQLGFARVDLGLHVEYQPGVNGDLLTYARETLQPYAPTPFPEDYAMLVSFSHLFSSPVGYAAGYYSYKWAEVLDADAFTRFQKEGVFSEQVGNEFRRCILEAGDSEDPTNLYLNFMGREPSLDALMVRSGLVEAA
ncbi:MAG: hypothetical protein RJA70_4615 [Pseudomonadota bacterium]|jgi:oligopeptidase A